MQSSDLAIQYSIDGGAPVAVRLIQSRTVVGTSSQADIRIESPFMSRQHLVIEQQDNRLYVTDLGSSNGTTLHGRPLQPNSRQEWLPGQSLSVANIRLEHVSPQLTETEPTLNTGSLLNLIAEPREITVGQSSRLTLSYHGSAPQMIYFRSDSATDGLEIRIEPGQAQVLPGQAIYADVQTRKKHAYWTGGKFSVALVALTHNGEDTLTELIVKVRPRYALLLLGLLLLLAGGLAITAALPAIVAQVAPSATPTLTATASPTLTATATHTATDTPTSTPTATVTATPTPSHTPTATNTLMPTSTQIPTRAPSNTPFIVTVIVPQVFPVTVVSPPLIISPTLVTPAVPDNLRTACAGFAGRSPLQELPDGVVTFVWDAPASSTVGYSLIVTNLDSERSTSAATGVGVTSVTLDVGQQALGEGLRFSWQVSAQLLDGRTCTAAPISLTRSRSTFTDCDDSANPCPVDPPVAQAAS